MFLNLCTSNDVKRREFERILGVRLQLTPLDLPEIQAIDVAQVCRTKAELAFAQLGQPAIVDDTGFELAALKGFPGALVTWALEADGVCLLHRMLPEGATTSAVAVTCVGLADGEGVHIFAGRVAGHVLAEPRGNNGFGFDPVFVPEGDTRTFAEMDDQEKDRRSPRGLALSELAQFLGRRLDR